MINRSAVLVRVTRHGQVVQTYAFDQDLIRIGRDPRSDVMLPSKDISRIHCRLERDGRRVLVTDSGSSNGTLVNGKRADFQEIETGDSIQIGDFTLWIELVATRDDQREEAFEHQNEQTVPRRS